MLREATAPAAATHQHGMHQTMQASQPHGNMSGGMHGPSSAGHAHAGEQQREIKALSGQDIQAYENGQGHGFAKAAELNGYPGPMHTLELASGTRILSLVPSHHNHAIGEAIGIKLEIDHVVAFQH